MRHPGHLLWRRWMLPSARGKRWWAHFLFLESKPMAHKLAKLFSTREMGMDLVTPWI